MSDRIRETHQLVESRLGKQFGENKKSTMEDMVNCAREIFKNYAESKEMLATVFQKLRLLEEKLLPKRVDLDTFSENQVDNLEMKSRNLVAPDDQFNSASDTGLRSTERSSKRRSSIRSEPGDIKGGLKEKLKTMSKSTSQIENRVKSRKDPSTLKKSSKGKYKLAPSPEF